MRKILLYILLLTAATAIGRTWHTDKLLGTPFQATTVSLPDDYSGPERCTIVRLVKGERVNRYGVLYVHGFNDYFFQAQMADSFVAQGYDFYAVDLHRYGRSLMPGQHPCDVRNINQYFPDIDSAICVMKSTGIEHIVLMGHSTGGLITSYYMAHNPDKSIEALVLNSPFLDWNMGKLEPFIPLVSAVGAILPGIEISSGSGDAYWCSLSTECHGEWYFDDSLKSHPSPKVTLGWVRAITNAQKYLREHPYSIKVPILLMYSAQSYNGEHWSEEAQKSDAVLDVNDIAKYGKTLGHNEHILRVHGGLHDLSLSSKPVRDAWYKALFRWLDTLPHPAAED